MPQMFPLPMMALLMLVIVICALFLVRLFWIAASSYQEGLASSSCLTFKQAW